LVVVEVMACPLCPFAVILSATTDGQPWQMSSLAA